ncbi:hypothetical protein [Actinobaculum sp. 352]|uniref:hypothetical protein n=1 Tax=Actinobaculum sp. 352 TaxID=2490946 RepID=UPI0013DEF0BC|nr:hypothetical protein [Actinobaculum sp. 352]
MRSARRQRVHRSIAASVIAALCFLAAACGVYRPEVAEVTPSVPSTFVATDEARDVMHADVPSGWSEVPVDGEAIFLITPDGSSSAVGVASISAAHFPLVILDRSQYRAYGGDANEYDLERWMRGLLIDRERYPASSSFVLLPDRYIDGNPARGFSCVFRTADGTARRWETWYVGRHDGVWEIRLTSGPGHTELPAELDGILDTVRWTAPSSDADG